MKWRSQREQRDAEEQPAQPRKRRSLMRTLGWTAVVVGTWASFAEPPAEEPSRPRIEKRGKARQPSAVGRRLNTIGWSLLMALGALAGTIALLGAVYAASS